MYDNLENHMVLNTADAPWNQPDADDEPEEERDFEADFRRMGRRAHDLQLKIDGLQRGIRDFLGALDRGYFGAKDCADLTDTAFVDALRKLADNPGSL